MNTQKLHYLKALDIQVWQSRHAAPSAPCDDTERAQAVAVCVIWDETADQPSARQHQLLNAMLHALGLNQQQTHIINSSTDTDTPLTTQLAQIQPNIIIVLGENTAHSLLGITTPLAALRTQTHHYQTIPLFITYAPSSLLTNPRAKRDAYQDLLTATNSM
jgi:DNA polymerase III psi subunit